MRPLYFDGILTVREQIVPSTADLASDGTFCQISHVKVLLISIGRLPWYRKGAPLHFFYTPRLGLPYIAAVTPPEHDVEILDGVQLEDIDFDQGVDLVGFSILTPFANASYEAADRFRSRGVRVVMGGQHTTLMPEEAAQHADAVVVGEGEELWPRLLDDIEHNGLKRTYRQDTPVDFARLPAPSYACIRNTDYMVKNGFQLVRGCPHGAQCAYCIAPRMFGTEYRCIPVRQALEQIEACAEADGVSGINVSACCALNNRPYMRTFAEAVRPLAVNWCGGALLHLIDDDDYLGLLADSGCTCIYTETEVTSERKDPAKHALYCDVAGKLRELGIDISYNFTVGLDVDTEEVFAEVEAFIEQGRLSRELCAVQFYVPWPNTPAYNRMEQAGRILSRDWSRYDNTHVVFTPKRMSVEALGGAESRSLPLTRLRCAAATSPPRGEVGARESPLPSGERSP